MQEKKSYKEWRFTRLKNWKGAPGCHLFTNLRTNNKLGKTNTIAHAGLGCNTGFVSFLIKHSSNAVCSWIGLVPIYGWYGRH